MLVRPREHEHRLRMPDEVTPVPSYLTRRT